MTTTRHEFDGPQAKLDIWSKLAAPLPVSAISWRQDGRAIQRDGKYSARFVCYVDAQTVRERLDLVIPGEWDLTLELLPQQQNEDGEPLIGFKARLTVLGVIREDVGQGRDYKAAATDAFKRAAVRFGIAHELYAVEQVWVQVDGDGKYAKPLEDPATAYARRHGQSPRAAAKATPVASKSVHQPDPQGRCRIRPGEAERHGAAQSLTLDVTLAKDPNAFNGIGGKKLRDCSLEELQTAIRWYGNLQKTEPQAGRQKRIDALELVIQDRLKDQTNMFGEGAPAAAPSRDALRAG